MCVIIIGGWQAVNLYMAAEFGGRREQQLNRSDRPRRAELSVASEFAAEPTILAESTFAQLVLARSAATDPR
jgi:hypothetical protein